MDLLNKTKELCRAYDIHPARSKGQNFLIKEEIYDEIIEAAELKKEDVVLEVGPGLGFLTAKLALRLRSPRPDFGTKAGQAGGGGKVIAVELDDKLAEVLRAGLAAKGVGNVEVVNQNILDFRFSDLLFRHSREGGNPEKSTNETNAGNLWIPDQVGDDKKGKFKIVANLPYNITSVFLRKFLGEAEIKPSLMVLMLQKEVAERICAKAGEMSLLSVSVQFYAEPEIIKIAPADNFWPKPKVDSAIVRIRIKSPLPPLYKGGNLEKDFFRLVKIGFSARRKMLKNNLAAGFYVSTETAENWLKKAGFNPKIRAQELSVDDWVKLLGEVKANMV